MQKIREELKLKPIRISYIKEQFNSIQGNVLDLIQLIKQRVQEANLAAQSIIMPINYEVNLTSGSIIKRSRKQLCATKL